MSAEGRTTVVLAGVEEWDFTGVCFTYVETPGYYTNFKALLLAI